MLGGLAPNGDLIVGRKSGHETVECPYTDRNCGTWCAQFSEPIHQRNPKKQDRLETVIHLCHGKHWKFTSFEDSRESSRL